MGVFSISLTWHSKQALVGEEPLWISFGGNEGAAFKNSLTTTIIMITPTTAITRKKFICPLFFFFAMIIRRNRLLLRQFQPWLP